MTPWFLYLIRTADNKLYTGITTDVERRYQQHQSGKGAKALRGKGELTLAFSAPVGDRSLALRAEYRVKQLTKRQKERLVCNQVNHLIPTRVLVKGGEITCKILK
ncbi:GIY-YIG nuclease family protein [Escherichia coli]|uniref:GIY-YIG nuclease family protein n=1 Tax=Escherichia coli TaxID=562 RepID=UPI000A3E3B6E|nr:GIY-YIG nuclease family protein [Escherichia coli]